jgi:hypothetical protein
MVDIVQNGITVTISGSPTTGTYMTNGYYVVGTCTVTAISPTPTGSGATRRHGAMKNPVSLTQQGYDGRMDNSGGEQEYNAALDVSLSLPLTLNAGDCLVVSKSGNLAFSDLEPGVAGGNAQMMEAFATIHCVASAPASPSTTFRPPYAGTVRNTFTTADIVGTLPNFAAPHDPVGVELDDYHPDDPTWLNAVQYHLILPVERANNRMPPRGQQLFYPSDRARIVHSLGLLSCTDHARKIEARNKVIQDGIDLWGCMEATGNSGMYLNGAGYGAGRYFPILYAGYMLGNSTILGVLDDPWENAGGQYQYGNPDLLGEPVGAFWETTSLYMSDTAWSGYSMPRVSYPDGKPLYGDARELAGVGDNDARKEPNKVYDSIADSETQYGTGLPAVAGWGDYMHLSCSAFIGGFITARLMGIDNYYPLAAKEFAYRWINDPLMWNKVSIFGNAYQEDVYAYGGYGNGFNRALWLAHGTMADYDAGPAGPVQLPVISTPSLTFKTVTGVIPPQNTIGALTLLNSGARVVGSGLTNGTYQTYWTISSNTTLTRNGVAGTPTPGTYNMGGAIITVEPNVYDVSTSELAAVIAVGSAIDGKTIKILPGIHANATGLAAALQFPVTLSVPNGLTITSRDTSNPGYMHRAVFKHSGVITLSDIFITDVWSSGDYPFMAVIDMDTANYSTPSISKVIISKCEMYSDTVTAGDMNPAAVTSITTGRYYIISSVASANWSSVGGPVSAVIGDSFMCNSTNANIASLGTVKPWPRTLRLLQGASVFGTNQLGRELTITDSYLHNGEYGVTGRMTRLDIQRNRFNAFYGDMMQFQPTGNETLWRIKDNWMQAAIGDAASPFGVHLDYLQANLGDMTKSNTIPYEVIGNRLFGKGGTEAGQGIFFENPAAYQVKLIAKHNMLLTAQANGITIEQPAATSEIRWNTVAYDMKYSPGGLVPKILADLEIGSGAAVRENIHSGLAYTFGSAPLSWNKTINNQEFAAFTNAGMDDYLTGTDFNSDNIADLAAFTAAMMPRAGTSVDTAFPKIGAGHYYSWGAAPAGSRSGLGAGTANEPTIVVPYAYIAGMWSIASNGTTGQAVVTINSHPNDGGAYVTNIEYKIGAGSWISAGTTSTFTITSGLTDGVAANIVIRDVNSVGSGSTSDTKSVTTGSSYTINAVEFGVNERITMSSGFSATGSKKALFSFNIYIPTTWVGGGGMVQFLNSGGTPRASVSTTSLGRIMFSAQNAAGSDIVNFVSDSSEFSADTWYTVAFSMDTTTGVNRLQAKKRPSGGAWSDIAGAKTILITDGIIGDCTRCYINDAWINVYLADVYATIGQDLDLSNTTLLNKFLPSVSKGAAGALPTGTAPQLFLANPAASFHTNLGTGGGLTGLVGTLSTAPSSPT